MTNAATTRRRSNRRQEEQENHTMTTEVSESRATNEELGMTVDMSTRIQFPVSIPIGLRIALVNAAKEHNVKPQRFALDALAKSVSYTGPMGGGRNRGGTQTEEEKKAAARARNAARKELINDLMAKFGIGDTEEDDEDDED